MKKKQIDLDDIGFVGGGRQPTEEDFKDISAWIQARKKQQAKKKTRTSTVKKNRKTI